MLFFFSLQLHRFMLRYGRARPRFARLSSHSQATDLFLVVSFLLYFLHQIIFISFFKFSNVSFLLSNAIIKNHTKSNRIVEANDLVVCLHDSFLLLLAMHNNFSSLFYGPSSFTHKKKKKKKNHTMHQIPFVLMASIFFFFFYFSLLFFVHLVFFFETLLFRLAQKKKAKY